MQRQFMEAQEKMLVAQTSAIALQSAPPLTMFTGDKVMRKKLALIVGLTNKKNAVRGRQACQLSLYRNESQDFRPNLKISLQYIKISLFFADAPMAFIGAEDNNC